MKKILFLMLFAIMAIGVQAQSVSYANLMKLSKMNTVSEISSTLRSWGYKLGQTGRKENYEVYLWGFGTAEYEEYLDDWTTSGSNWAMFAYLKYDDGSGIMRFSFPSTTTYSQVKSQIEANGWKMTKESTSTAGFDMKYEKAGTYNYITLRECTSEAGGFDFTYTWINFK